MRPACASWMPIGGALAVHELDDPAPGLGLLVVPDARVLRGDPALRDDRRGLGEHQPEATGGARRRGGRGASRPARRPSAEYWHIGASHTRLRTVSERRVIGSNSLGKGPPRSTVALDCDNQRTLATVPGPDRRHAGASVRVFSQFHPRPRARETRVAQGGSSPSGRTTSTGSTEPCTARSACTPTALRCGGWGSTPSTTPACCVGCRSRTPTSCDRSIEASGERIPPPWRSPDGGACRSTSVPHAR